MNLVLETDRLVLRPLEEGDVDLCVTLYTDPEVMKFIREPRTAAQVEEKMPLFCRRAGGIGVWCVADKANDEKLGTAVLLPLPVEEHDLDWSLLSGDGLPDAEIEVGYILRQQAWGRGIATEACKRLLKFGFEDVLLDEIVAVTDPDNLASQNVLRKCGLVYKGTRRAYRHDDLPDYRLKREAWLTLQNDIHPSPA